MTAGKGFLRQGLTHAHYQFLDRIRSPLSIILGLGMPVMTFLFFVVPQSSFTRDPKVAASALVAFCIFGMMANSIIGFAGEISVNREKGWSSYMSSLPNSSLARMLGYLISVGLLAVLSIIPLLIVSLAVTRVGIEGLRWPATFLMLVVSSLPFMLIGTLIGFLFSARSSIAITQVLMLALAFAGALLVPPVAMPGWLNGLSLLLPTRNALELNLWVALGGEFPAGQALMWLAWVALSLLLCVWAVRRSARSSGSRP